MELSGESLASLAKAADAKPECLHNFVHKGIRKPTAPSRAELEKVLRHVMQITEIEGDPTIKACLANIRTPIGAGNSPVTTVQKLLEIDDTQLGVELDYIGRYITYRYSFRPFCITTSWLSIEASENTASSKIMTFTNYQRSETALDVYHSGYVVPYRDKLYCVGTRAKTVHLHLSILNMVDVPDFRFLHGIVLATTLGGHIFSSNVFCRRLPEDATLEEWVQHIGVFSMKDKEAMKRIQSGMEEFPVWDHIENKIGDGGVLKSKRGLEA
jgi:hypothetical protein